MNHDVWINLEKIFSSPTLEPQSAISAIKTVSIDPAACVELGHRFASGRYPLYTWATHAQQWQEHSPRFLFEWAKMVGLSAMLVQLPLNPEYTEHHLPWLRTVRRTHAWVRDDWTRDPLLEWARKDAHVHDCLLSTHLLLNGDQEVTLHLATCQPTPGPLTQIEWTWQMASPIYRSTFSSIQLGHLERTYSADASRLQRIADLVVSLHEDPVLQKEAIKMTILDAQTPMFAMDIPDSFP